MLKQDELKEVVDIAIELSTTKDESRLLQKILLTAIRIADCDAGTLYLENNGNLEFKIMETLSLNIRHGMESSIDLPPIPVSDDVTNACGYSAYTRELINIHNVDSRETLEWSGHEKYDKLIGYDTKSMLVVPMITFDDELVGVLQLINAFDANGNPADFSNDDEYIARTLGALAAVSIINMRYTREMKLQMKSFVDAFAKAIDERTPYNGSHTKKVTKYCKMIAKHINRLYETGECDDYFDENRMDQLIMAASLHDIGKMVVPLTIMNKATRLEEHLNDIEKRFELLKAYYEIDYLKGIILEPEYKEKTRYLDRQLEFIKQINTMDYVDDASIEIIKDISKKGYKTRSGELIMYLTEYETECLEIRRGTLTNRERCQMENHVVLTGMILDKVHFNSKYNNVEKIAMGHHEYLDGSGYPYGLKAEQLMLESRILAVADIYDALTSTDRPYKKPISQEKAFKIIEDMAEKGKLEIRLVRYLKEAVYEAE